MIQDFVAIDFETANEQASSICSVGLVVVRNKKIVEKHYSLIQPEPNYYKYWNTRVHGLTEEDTAQEAIFPKVWQEFSNIIGSLPLVAHNKSFDERCLKTVYSTYQMDYPDYEFYCTLQVARRKLKHLPNHQLKTVAEDCGYILRNHHHALADAEACAEIAIQLL